MAIAEELLALPPGAYLIRVNDANVFPILCDMNAAGAIQAYFDKDVLDGVRDLRNKAIIIQNEINDHSKCTLEYLVHRGCRVYHFCGTGLYHYRIENGRLITSANPPTRKPDIDAAIAHTAKMIEDLQDTLRRLEDLHFDMAAKPAAKYFHEDI